MQQQQDASNEYKTALRRILNLAEARHDSLPDEPTIASREAIDNALLNLPRSLPTEGVGLGQTTNVLFDTILPSLAGGQSGPRYFGFVTGGNCDPAQIADMLVTLYDTSNAVSMPEETTASYIESLALGMVLDLLEISRDIFQGRSVTTGATASNVLGLGVAREYSVKKAKRRRDQLEDWSVAQNGHGNIDIRIYSAGAHASTVKAAAINGIGRSNIIEVTVSDDGEPCAFDLAMLEEKLKTDFHESTASIVCASIGEVNTSGLTPSIPAVRKLCDKYEAFLHVDAAFGAFSVLHPDFSDLSEAMACAHSLTVDGHKWLNVPYDCAMFFCADAGLLNALCGPGNNGPAYFKSEALYTETESQDIAPQLKALREEAASLTSPYYSNLENSRRFRALPLYASLVSLGKTGYQHIVRHNIEFARRAVEWLEQSPDYDVLLPTTNANFRVMNIVLFAPSAECRDASLRGPNGAKELVRRVKLGRKIYVTGTQWQGRPAVRLAVSNWSTTIERDFPIVVEVLESVVHST